MRLLAIETSSPRGSLAVLEGRRVLERATFPEGLVHGREITLHLQALMGRAGILPGDLGAIAVGLGPGSFTGIRVGVTAAKTLSLALRIPVVGESSLRVIAAGAFLGPAPPVDPAGETRVVPVVDGKQRHIYISRFRGPDAVREAEDIGIRLPWHPRGASPAPEASTLSPEALAGLEMAFGPPGAGPGPTLLGDSADSLIAAGAARGGTRGPAELDFPRADILGLLAVDRLEAESIRFDAESSHALSPIYLRSSEAERKLEARR